MSHVNWTWIVLVIVYWILTVDKIACLSQIDQTLIHCNKIKSKSSNEIGSLGYDRLWKYQMLQSDARYPPRSSFDWTEMIRKCSFAYTWSKKRKFQYISHPIAAPFMPSRGLWHGPEFSLYICMEVWQYLILQHPDTFWLFYDN